MILQGDPLPGHLEILVPFIEYNITLSSLSCLLAVKLVGTKDYSKIQGSLSINLHASSL